MFLDWRIGRFIEEIRAGRCELPHLLESVGSMLTGDTLGVAAVALEAFEIPVCGVFVRLFEVRT